jgi:hypothetical protein
MKLLTDFIIEEANMDHSGHEHLHHRKPEEADEGEIVGRPTLLAKYAGRVDENQILGSLRQIGYPPEDVSVLFQLEGSDQVVDQFTGHVAAGQALTDEELARQREERGHTAVLMHPEQEQFEAVKGALSALGEVQIDYSGETHAFGRLGGVDRIDEGAEQPSPDEQAT